MVPVSPEILSWADLLSKVMQLFFGLCALILTVWAATTKRKDIFRSELTKKQLAEVGRLRDELHALFFDLHFIPSISQNMRIMQWNFNDLREKDPDAWDQVQRYKRTSLDLYYKFSSKKYYLFPDWLDENKISDFAEEMKVFQPFTLLSTSSRNEEERRKYAVKIVDLKDYFDEALRANA